MRAAAALTVALTACGGAAPERVHRDPGRYSTARYVVGHGESTAGAAGAEADARRDVASQLGGALEATFSAELSESDGQARAQIQSLVKTQIRFERGELIRVVPEETRCEGTRCRALAVLERDAAVRALSAEYEPRSAAFRRACQAATAGEGSAFTLAWREADAAWPELAARGRELEVIGQGAYEPLAADRRQISELRARRDTLLRRSAVTVLPPELPDEPLRAPLTEALAAAFHSLGLAAAPGASCAEGLAFAPRGAVKCGPGPLGPRCEMSLQGELRPCAGGAPLAAVDLSGAGLAGAHTGSEADARQRLARRLVPEVLAPALRAALRDVLPVQ